MTDPLRQGLVALADSSRVPALDLVGVRRTARARRRRRRAGAAAALSAVLLLGVAPVRGHLTGTTHERLSVATPAGTPAGTGHRRVEAGDPERRRLLAIADRQAAPGRAGQVLVLRTDPAGYTRLTGADPGPLAPPDLWLLQVSGDLYRCAGGCGPAGTGPTGTYLTLLVDARDDTLVGYGLRTAALDLPPEALLLRG